MDPAVTRPDELRSVESRSVELRLALAAIARRLGYHGSLAPELRLVEDLRLDSVGMLTLAVEVEDHFKVCLDADDEAAIRTVGDLERVLLAKLGAAVE